MKTLWAPCWDSGIPTFSYTLSSSFMFFLFSLFSSSSPSLFTIFFCSLHSLYLLYVFSSHSSLSFFFILSVLWFLVSYSRVLMLVPSCSFVSVFFISWFISVCLPLCFSPSLSVSSSSSSVLCLFLTPLIVRGVSLAFIKLENATQSPPDNEVTDHCYYRGNALWGS